MIIKPLIERLSKENFDKLMNYEFTNLRTFITKALETNKFWSDLTIEEAMSLNDLFYNEPLTIQNLNKLFVL